MSRETFVRRNGKIIPKSEAEPIERTAAPHIISDYLPDLVHPSTGKRMDSKSRFRAETRARGLTEVGTEQLRDTRRIEMPDMKRSIADAIERLGG